MKSFISLLLVVAFLLVYIALPVVAAPAVAGAGVVAGLLAFLSYYGISTAADGVTQADLTDSFNDILLDYATYKASTIADLFPAAKVLYSLGRCIIQPELAQAYAEFTDWYMDGEDSKTVVQNSGLGYGGVTFNTFNDGGLTQNQGTYYTTIPVAMTGYPSSYVANCYSLAIKTQYWYCGPWEEGGKIGWVQVIPKPHPSIAIYYGININATGMTFQQLAQDSNRRVTNMFNAPSNYTSTADYTFIYMAGDDRYPITVPILSSVPVIDVPVTTVASAISTISEEIVITGVPTYPKEDGEPAINEDVVIGVQGLPLDKTGEDAALAIIDAVIEGGLVTTEAQEETLPVPDPELGISGLSDRFPFSLPYDLYYAVSLLQAEPLPPAFTLPLKVPGVGTYTLDIDLQDYDSVATVLRTMEVILFCVGLAIVTNKILR